MKLTTKIYSGLLLFCGIALLAACAKDNLEAPSSTLSGHITFNGQALSVRTPTVSAGAPSSGVQLELWQHGYQLFTKIPVYVAQDGSYSASLFDGDYKLVRVNGAPWVDGSDSLDVHVSGNTVKDVPVNPYFTITNAAFTFNKADTSVTATFTVNQNVTGKTVELSTIFVGATGFVDTNNLITSIEAAKTVGTTITVKQPIAPSSFPDVGTTSKDALRRSLKNNLLNKGYGFFRVGVKTTGVTERIYTPVARVDFTY